MNLVYVKWQTQKYSDVEVNTEDPPEEFKAKLFSLTGVPIERQKVFIAGAVLGDSSFEGMKLRDVKSQCKTIWSSF